jgi:hypothetical protein
MSLTKNQLQALKAAIAADPVFGTLPQTADNADFIARELNKDADPVVKAWGAAVLPQASDEAPDYSTFDALQAGKRDSWGFFLARARNFGRNKVRKWITDVWGNATANSNAEAILLAGTENASRAEVIFGGNSKTTGTVTALDRSWIGDLSLQDVQDAWNS